MRKKVEEGVCPKLKNFIRTNQFIKTIDNRNQLLLTKKQLNNQKQLIDEISV